MSEPCRCDRCVNWRVWKKLQRYRERERQRMVDLFMEKTDHKILQEWGRERDLDAWLSQVSVLGRGIGMAPIDGIETYKCYICGAWKRKGEEHCHRCHWNHNEDPRDRRGA